MEQMNLSSEYGITQSVIDMAGFYTGNYIAHKISSDIKKANGMHTIVFGIADLVVRNNDALTVMQNYKIFSGNVGQNAYIGLVAFVGNSLIDLLKNKSFGDAVKDNLISSAIGVATNTIIDSSIVPASLN